MGVAEEDARFACCGGRALALSATEVVADVVDVADGAGAAEWSCIERAPETDDAPEPAHLLPLLLPRLGMLEFGAGGCGCVAL